MRGTLPNRFGSSGASVWHYKGWKMAENSEQLAKMGALKMVCPHIDRAPIHAWLRSWVP